MMVLACWLLRQSDDSNADTPSPQSSGFAVASKAAESEQNPYGASTDGFVARYSGSYWRQEYLHLRWCGHL